MGRPPAGARALTNAERQAKNRTRREAELVAYRTALERIATTRTAREAREIARVTLGGTTKEKG